jgi:hypothetical protein
MADKSVRHGRRPNRMADGAEPIRLSLASTAQRAGYAQPLFTVSVRTLGVTIRRSAIKPIRKPATR